jgi:hypothetical protein
MSCRGTDTSAAPMHVHVRLRIIQPADPNEVLVIWVAVGEDEPFALGCLRNLAGIAADPGLPIGVGAHKFKGPLQPKREPLVRCFLANPARIMRRPRYANECWSCLRSSRRLGSGVSVAGPALDVSPLPGASPHPPRSRAAGVSAGGNLYEPTDLEADIHCREAPSWTGWFAPKGDRWWRVWACSAHLD